MVTNIRSISKSYQNDKRDLQDISHIQYFKPSIRGISTSIPFRAELYFHRIIRSTIKTYTIHEEDNNISPISIITWEDDSIKDITIFVRRKQ